jgi:hypothetical protein
MCLTADFVENIRNCQHRIRYNSSHGDVLHHSSTCMRTTTSGTYTCMLYNNNVGTMTHRSRHARLSPNTYLVYIPRLQCMSQFVSRSALGPQLRISSSQAQAICNCNPTATGVKHRARTRPGAAAPGDVHVQKVLTEHMHMTRNNNVETRVGSVSRVVLPCATCIVKCCHQCTSAAFAW